MNSFLSFLKWKCSKSAQNVIFHAILANFEPYDPLRGLLQDQQSTFKGSYSPKSLHKLVLPENGFISIIFEVKMLLRSPKVDVGGQNLQNFDLKRPIKFRKVLQTSQFLVKSCVIERSCCNFTLKFHIYFYLWLFSLLVSKMGIFQFFIVFFARFLRGEGLKKDFSIKVGWNMFWHHFCL